LSRYRRKNDTAESAKVIVIQYSAVGRGVTVITSVIEEVIVDLHHFQEVKARGSKAMKRCHCLDRKTRTLMRVIAMRWEADVNRKRLVDDRYTSFHHSKEPISSSEEPQAL
jgi:hypothetical protein